MIVFAVFGWVWYAWRLLGAFLALGAALLALGYLRDRRERRRRQRDLAEASPRALGGMTGRQDAGHAVTATTTGGIQ